ncbi:MAG: ABC transporter ATP-binding protein [Clostridiales bacterium]|nr:ABC transporter ATP-binding protein [Clostridiales bacterium]
MNIGGILINKEIPTALLDSAQETAKRLGTDDEALRFIVVCDLDANSHYGTSLLCVTNKRSFVLDEAGGQLAVLPHADVAEAKVRRMYGNARLVAKTKDGDTTELTRFTYAVASLCDMAADYIMAVAGGEDEARALATVEATYDKLMLFCPKCGRRLLHPGADCINCQSKGKTFTKLARYLKPEIPNLIVCLFLSLISTALTMVPPTMISTLVDDILPGRDLAGLYRIVALLMATHISFCIIGMIRSYRLRLSGDKVVYSLRNDVFAKAQHLSMRFYDKTSTGSVINRISGDTNTIQAFMLRVTQEVVTQFFSMIGIAVIMFAMNYRLALLTLAPIPFIVMGSRIFGRKIKPFYRRIWRKWVAVTAVLTDALPGIRVIKAFSAEKRSGESFRQYNTAWLDVDKKSARISTSFPFIVNFFVTCGTMLIWGIGGG